MKERTLAKGLLFWLVLLGADALGLYLIFREYGDPDYFFMDTMPVMFCVAALIPLLAAVFRYLPRRKGPRILGCCASVVLAIAIGMGGLYASYSDEKINVYYWKMFSRFSGKDADEAALASLCRQGLDRQLSLGEVEYGDKLALCYYYTDDDGASRVAASFERARGGDEGRFGGFEPERLARSLEEADTAVFFYTEDMMLYTIPWEERNTHTGERHTLTVPVYGTDTMLFAVDLATNTATEPVSVAYREPEDTSHYRASGFRGGLDMSAVERAVLGE